MKSDLIRIHHADYQEDIPFWIQSLDGLDPILEIGCGHGRVSLPLLASGFSLVGIDYDKSSLAFLQKVVESLPKGDQARISLVLGDILTYDPTDLFGGVIIPCNTYSTFAAAGRLRLLQKIYSCLKTGGIFIAGFPNPLLLEKILTETLREEPEDPPDREGVFTHPETGFPVLVSSRLRAGDSSLYWDWIYDHLHPDGEVERFVATVEHHQATRKQLLEELDRAGFSDVSCLGDYGGNEYAEDSPYLILVCRK
jgi:SAM-dependent methyltransferase